MNHYLPFTQTVTTCNLRGTGVKFPGTNLTRVVVDAGSVLAYGLNKPKMASCVLPAT